MNGHTTEPAQHLGDEELLRLLDDEGDAAWRADSSDHLAVCSRCARELELLAADAALIRQHVDRAAFEDDLAPPALRRPRRGTGRVPNAPWLRAAAVLLLLAAPVAALPGLRAWIVDAVTGTTGDALPETRTMAAPAAANDAAVIRFVPLPGTFAVVVDAPQQEGTLHIRRSSAGVEAVLETAPAPGAAAVEPVIGETSLRLRNTAGSASSYTLVVPPGVRRVTVSVAGTTVADLGADALGSNRAVPLRRP
jgi:anti-sigma factor RsiW